MQLRRTRKPADTNCIRELYRDEFANWNKGRWYHPVGQSIGINSATTGWLAMQKTWWDVCSGSATDPQSILSSGPCPQFSLTLVRKTKSNRQKSEPKGLYSNSINGTMWLIILSANSVPRRLSTFSCGVLLRLSTGIIRTKSPQMRWSLIRVEVMKSQYLLPLTQTCKYDYDGKSSEVIDKSGFVKLLPCRRHLWSIHRSFRCTWNCVWEHSPHHDIYYSGHHVNYKQTSDQCLWSSFLGSLWPHTWSFYVCILVSWTSQYGRIHESISFLIWALILATYCPYARYPLTALFQYNCLVFPLLVPETNHVCCLDKLPAGRQLLW